MTEEGGLSSTKSAVNAAGGVVSGVAGGFMIMAVPIIMLGLAIALSSFLIRAPVAAVNRRLM